MKRISRLFLVFILLFTSIFGSSCKVARKDITPEQFMAKLNQITTPVLLDSYVNYPYLELEVEYYEGEKIDPIKKETIFIHNIIELGGTMDLQIFIKTEDTTKTTYELFRKESVSGVNYYKSILIGEELTKFYQEIISDEEYNALLNLIFEEYYSEEILPEREDQIIKACRYSVSTDVNKLRNLEAVFNGTYKNEQTINTVRFNYSTNKIHYFEVMTTEYKKIKSVEYTYPGNFVTNPHEINLELFDLHKHDFTSNPEICSVCQYGAVARINDTLYSNILESLSACNETDNVVLLSDIDISESLVIDKEISIDLNSFSISAKNIVVGDGVFHVIENGKLTLNGNGVVNGASLNPESDGYHMAIWADGGEVIINGGIYTNTDAPIEDEQLDLIYAKNNGSIIINDGIFKSKSPQWTLNLHDSTSSTILVKGGTFIGYNPSKSNTEPGDDLFNFVADGYISILNEIDGVITYKVVQNV